MVMEGLKELDPVAMLDLLLFTETLEKKKISFNLLIKLMSLKKGKFTISDVKFMKFAINLAKNNKGLTGTNPSVGCVVTKNNNIISYGSTDIKGRPHAEVIALRKKGLNTKGATVYLTLEPCTHFGKTPPCTNQLIKSNIKKVIYSDEKIQII